MARKVTIAVWLVLNLALLILWLWTEPWVPGGEGYVFLGWATLLLTLPAGLIVAVLVGSAIYLLTVVLGTASLPGWVTTLLLWALMVAAGYLQWFELVPRAFRRLRSRRAEERRPGRPTIG